MRTGAPGADGSTSVLASDAVADRRTIPTRFRGHPGSALATWAALRPSREGYALGAVVLVGFGSTLAVGRYQPVALLAIVIGAGAALLSATGRPGQARTPTWCVAAFVGAICTAFLLGASPLEWVGPCAGGLGGVVAILTKRRVLRLAGASVAGLVSLVVIAKSITWGRADIDVFNFTQRATEQLLHGRDPYAMSYPTTTPHLPLAHYFYLPGTLFLSIPGRLLGDVRVSDLLAAAVLIGAVTILARRSGGGERAWRLLVLCLTLPFFPLMVLFGWTEVYFTAAIAVWLVLRADHPRVAILVLGLGMATVPTPLPLLVLPFLWWRRPRLEILAAALVALVICLPFALWGGPGQFVYANFLLNIHLPPLPVGLDLDAAFLRLTGAWPPAWIWPVVVVVSVLLAARARRRSWPTAFYIGSTFLLVVLLFAKWAIFNYYFLVVMGLVLALALERAGGQARATQGRTEPVPAAALPG